MSESEFSGSGIEGLGLCLEKEAVCRSDMFGMSTFTLVAWIEL